MILAEGMLSTLGITPIGAGLHDPPVELEHGIKRVSQGDALRLRTHLEFACRSSAACSQSCKS